MEKMAYDIARETHCIPSRDRKRVSVSEFYDFIAGTQVGAIAASMMTLSDKDGNPLHYAEDVRNFLKKNNSKLFIVKDLSTLTVCFIYALSVLVGGGIFYGLAVCIYKK
jgi:predicted acylesterase/phospholipase RssA